MDYIGLYVIILVVASLIKILTEAMDYDPEFREDVSKACDKVYAKLKKLFKRETLIVYEDGHMEWK